LRCRRLDGRHFFGEALCGLDQSCGEARAYACGTCPAPGADIILVEGFKDEPHPKLEVRKRGTSHKRPLAPEDPSILAIAAGFEVEDAGVPVFPLDDIETIAEYILARVNPPRKEYWLA
jgi:molybdopterin-guanine dinucleotide biosynthesis protein